jgi:hypothetical protein
LTRRSNDESGKRLPRAYYEGSATRVPRLAHAFPYRMESSAGSLHEAGKGGRKVG